MPVAAWWLLFLGIYPAQFKEYAESVNSEQQKQQRRRQQQHQANGKSECALARRTCLMCSDSASSALRPCKVHPPPTIWLATRGSCGLPKVHAVHGLCAPAHSLHSS